MRFLSSTLSMLKNSHSWRCLGRRWSRNFFRFPAVNLISRKVQREFDMPQLAPLKGYSVWIQSSLDLQFYTAPLQENPLKRYIIFIRFIVCFWQSFCCFMFEAGCVDFRQFGGFCDSITVAEIDHSAAEEVS